MTTTPLQLTQLITEATPPDDTLTLAYELRQKSRFRVVSDGGMDVGVFLPRSTLLRGGHLLRAENGQVFKVKAAAESLSVVRSEDGLAFARACYHLGNRHVALQIGAGELRYLHDHVLDDMVRGLGLPVEHEQAGFEPEPGAYHASPHPHTH